MNIPGFNAELSLYKTGRQYRLTEFWGGGAGGDVIPAQGKGCRCQPDPTCTSGKRNVCCFPNPDTGDLECNAGACCAPAPPPQECGPCHLDRTTLQFIQNCTSGARLCSSCTPETRIDLPFPISDRCIQVCCRSVDLSTCSITVREC